LTSTPARSADRVVGSSAPPLRALSATPALVILLLGGLALRLTIAYVLFPQSGFETDLSTYSYWADLLAEHGPGGFYATASFADYPPAYLYVLWAAGWVWDNVRIGGVSMALGDVLKIPPMLLDLVIGYVLYRLVLGWAWPGRRAEPMALLAAALYLFLPIGWYDSALWGQTDAVGALVILLGVAALIRGNSEGAAALGALAVLIKPQFGVVLVPIVAVVLLRRHLLVPGSGPRHLPWGPRRLGAWLAGHRGRVRLLTSLGVAIVVFHVVALPFGMGIPEYLAFLSRTAATYPWLTVNAFGPWALVPAAGQASLTDAFPFWISDTAPLVGPIPGVVIGGGVLVAGYLWGLARLALRDDRMTILMVTAYLALAFFILPTRVHERYVFPTFVLLPILAVASRRWMLSLAMLTIASFINLHAVLTATNPRYGTPALWDLPPGPLFREAPLILLSVALHTLVFLGALWVVRPWARQPLDGLAAAAQEVEGQVGAGPLPLGIRQVGDRGRPVSTASGAEWQADGMPSGPPPGGTSAIPMSEPVARGPSVGSWLIARFLTRPLRRDRSAALAGEPGGRFDRLDLVAVVLVLVASLSLRGYRLAEPYDMYFDEVYHARTGMEFLQDWRYGIDHSIYEYTHPHLAKYAMALGIVAFGDHRVTAQSDLGVPVKDAAIEVRWSPEDSPGERDGDRLYVATGDRVVAWDLRDRARVASLDRPAVAVAVDADAHRLVAASRDGAIRVLDTTLLDAVRRDPHAELPGWEPLADVGDVATLTGLSIVDSTLIVRDDAGGLRAFDLDTGELTGRADVPGVTAIVGLPWAERLVATPADVPDGQAREIADLLADDLVDDPERIRTLLVADLPSVAIAAWLDDATRSAIRQDIDAGLLPGVELVSGPLAAVAGTDGVSVLDATSLTSLDRLETGPAAGLALVERGLDAPALYASSGDELHIARVDDGVALRGTMTMPGAVGALVWNEPANLVHALGLAPDGAPAVYVVDPHGESVFADARLPFSPVATVADTQPERPGDDRNQLLALSADGHAASVDIGSNAFGYRLPGVLMGALTAVCLYLLTRLLFQRRFVAIAAAVLALAEGMLFANARIAMNDVYVTAFLVAAATLFAPVWLGRWRRPWVVAPVLVAVGLLLGLALASKWVAAYGIGGLILLVLLRSALGRITALAGLIGMTALLGGLAIRAADVPEPHRNWLFLLIMLALTAALAAAMMRRPVRMARDELRFGVLAAAVVGVGSIAAWLLVGSALPDDGLITADRLLVLGIGGLVLSTVSAGLARLAARWGRGPLAPRRLVDPSAPVPDPAPGGWLRPGPWLGVPWLFALACLALLPIGVYVLSYAPWVDLGNQWVEGVPAGHTGQTLWDLTVSMYQYHDHLRATHAASSPWWAWPLDLKPVWFYQEGFADDTLGVIYDSGNLVIFWMGIPAMLFAAWAAWVRRSLPLTLIVLLFAAMWLPWSRIDRATFQYHVYASLPFAVMALAYLVAELWHGPARVGWLMARLGASLAILGPPLLWLAREPLCAMAGTAQVYSGVGVCGEATRTADISEQAFWALVLLLVGGVVVTWQLWLAGRSGPRSRSGPLWQLVASTEGVIVTCALTLLAMGAAILLLGDEPAFTATVGAGELALCTLLLLLAPAWLVLRARDSRRFAAGLVLAAVLFLLMWYPNLTGLPLPERFANVYSFLLPTWSYSFQFAVNLDPPVKGGLVDGTTYVVTAVAVLLAVGAGLAARLWPSHPRPIRARASEGIAPEAA
jgi:predicted membrane-bound dolichyl-phosphate-mannose-protein mannosyltransferase